MGYRGKLSERQQARQLRRAGLPLAEIASRLGVSKSSVSVWVRDVPFDPLPRPPRGRRRAPNALQRRQAAMEYWSALTGIPPSQFRKPYRAVPDASIRHVKHVHGCVTVSYSCSAAHRSIMGLVSALLGDAAFRGSSIGRASGC
jgi:transcriptional regulator with XRE-family HTH domain